MSHMENLAYAQIDGGLYEKQRLLDEFAMAAMQGILSSETEMRANGISHTKEGAAWHCSEAYDIAEAMMAERERRLVK